MTSPVPPGLQVMYLSERPLAMSGKVPVAAWATRSTLPTRLPSQQRSRRPISPCRAIRPLTSFVSLRKVSRTPAGSLATF